MSEVRLNIVDSQQILQGTVYGSIADACVAALSAEPQTIAELDAALTRYIQPAGDAADQNGSFASFCSTPVVDSEPWDAGVVVIDLAARLVAVESIYSQPDREGEVFYHDGTQLTDTAIWYRVSDEWIFLNSITEYHFAQGGRSQERSKPPLDSRSILYGKPMLEFVISNVRQSSVCLETGKKPRCAERAKEPRVGESEPGEEEEFNRAVGDEISAIHARWLITSRADLEGHAPRDLLLAKREFIDFDLNAREFQWTVQSEGPPCLAMDSFAYRYAGFGTHECVIYYDLVRFLLWSTLDHQPLDESDALFDLEAEINWLEQTKREWLESPQRDFDGRVPALLIENERKRLPITLQARDMIIDENCDLCMMSAREVEMGYGPGFWHLDGSNMDEGFAFSFCRTQEEWEKENREREEFDKEFNRKWKEREERIARGEPMTSASGSIRLTPNPLPGYRRAVTTNQIRFNETKRTQRVSLKELLPRRQPAICSSRPKSLPIFSGIQEAIDHHPIITSIGIHCLNPLEIGRVCCPPQIAKILH